MGIEGITPEHIEQAFKNIDRRRGELSWQNAPLVFVQLLLGPLCALAGAAVGSYFSNKPVTALQLGIGIFFFLISALISAYPWLRSHRRARQK